MSLNRNTFFLRQAAFLFTRHEYWARPFQPCRFQTGCIYRDCNVLAVCPCGSGFTFLKNVPSDWSLTQGPSQSLSLAQDATRIWRTPPSFEQEGRLNYLREIPQSNFGLSMGKKGRFQSVSTKPFSAKAWGSVAWRIEFLSCGIGRTLDFKAQHPKVSTPNEFLEIGFLLK